MPCKKFIHDHLYAEAEQRSRQGLGYNIKLAKKFEKEVNDLFYEPVVRFFLNGDFVDRDITISDSLVEFHYNKQLSDRANTDKQSFVEDVISKGLREQLEAAEKYMEENAQDVSEMESYLDPIEYNNQERALEVATKLADRFEQMYNIPYEVISETEATRILENTPVGYNGEAGFYFGDKVYFVKGKLNLNTVIHEYAHPFVRAIRVDNSKLFESLYQQASSTAAGIEAIKLVAQEYPELARDSERFKEEVIVTMMEKHGAGLVSDQISTEEGYKTFIQKLLFVIRQLLRKAFPKLDVRNLQLTESIESLAEKLIKADVTIEVPSISQEDIAFFKKDLGEYAQSLKKVKGENLQEMVNTAYAEALVSLNALKNSKELSRKMDEVRVALERYQNIKLSKDSMSDEELVDSIEKSHEEFNRRALALINTVQDLENFAEKIETILSEIDSNKEHLTVKGIRRVQFFKDFINSQERLIDTLKEKSGLPKTNKFYQKLNSVDNSLQAAKKKIKTLQKEAVSEFFTSENIDMQQYAKERTANRIQQIMQVNKVPQEKIDNFLEDLFNLPANKTLTIKETDIPLNNTSQKELQKVLDEYLFKKITQDEVNDYLEGRRDDVNFFSAFTVPYTNIDDPIVGAFARFSKKLQIDVQTSSLKQWNEITAELVPLLKKVNYDPLSVESLGDIVLFEDTIGYYNQRTGKFERKKVFTFLNEFKDWRADYAELKNNFEEARSKGIKEHIKKAYKELMDFEEKYMHRSKTPEYYNLKKMFEKDNTLINPLTKESVLISKDVAADAFMERQVLLEEMNLLRKAQSPYTELENLTNYQYTDADIAKAKYEQLFSLYNPDNTPKVGSDLEKALILREYRKRSRDFYESDIDKTKVQDDFDNFVNRLAADNITPETDPENYRKYMELFEKRNFRIAYSKEYFDHKNRIMNTINSITSSVKENSDYHKAKSNLYQERLDIINLFRDKNGHPNGIEYTEAQRKRLKQIELDLIALDEKFDKKTGLTIEDRDTLTNYTSRVADGEKLSPEQLAEYTALNNKANASGLSDIENKMLNTAYAELAELTVKQATDYYFEAFEYVLGDVEGLEPITPENADDWINNEENLLKAFTANPQFEEWFKANHYEKDVWDPNTRQKVPRILRIAAWTISKPRDEFFYEKTKLIHPETKEEIIINGVPSGKYNYIKVKDKYLTVPRGADKKNYIGKVIDNRDNFLPRSYTPGDPNSAIDDKYVNKEYFDLKLKNPDAFALLEKLKETHLSIQEKKINNFSKLYLDLPRMALRNNVEYVKSGKARETFEEKVGVIKDRIKDIMPGGTKAGDAVELELANYNPEEMLVNTNLQGEPFSKIPVRGLYNLETKETSKDVLRSLSEYMYSINMNEALTETAPITQAIKDVLNDPDNAIKNMKLASKQVKNLTGRMSFIPKGSGNKRADAIETYIDRMWYGQTQNDFMEENPWLTKLANMLMKSASRSFIALDIPSALKNRYGMIFQSMIEASADKFYSWKSLAQGRTRSAKNIFELSSSQIYQIGPKSLDVQIMENFDPITGKTQTDFGKSSSRSFLKDIMDMTWLYDFRKLAEVEAGLQVFWAMMYHKTIDQTLPSGGVKKIKYADAFELDSKGILKLKEGIDPEYFNEPINHTVSASDSWESLSKLYSVPVEELKAKNPGATLEQGVEITISTGKKFKDFRLKVQAAGKRLNGLMDQFDSPQAEKYLGYRLFTFYKKFATGMFLNRFQADMTKGNRWGHVYDYEMGEWHKGYYITAMQATVKLLKNIREAYPLMTKEEKVAIQKVVTEVVGLMAFTAAIFLIFGYDPDDKERFQKLKQRQEEYGVAGWAANHMLYQLMMVKSENEIFVPIVGFNEWTQFYDSTSIAFTPTINLYVKIMNDLIYMGFGDDRAVYKQDAGPYVWQKEGSYKLWNHLASLFGVKGKTYDPTHAIKMAEIFENLR